MLHRLEFVLDAEEDGEKLALVGKAFFNRLFELVVFFNVLIVLGVVAVFHDALNLAVNCRQKLSCLHRVESGNLAVERLNFAE